ncbi:MAG TPA: hypothetical protein VK175_00720 [Leadbetterella sp.]|nr:hypothetical protein [Leadbetterella sp.]
MKKISLFIFIGILYLSCENNTQIFENESINGIVYFENEKLGELKTISTKTLVYLSPDSTGATFITKTETDSLGKFEFKFVPEKLDSVFIFSEKTIGGIKYTGKIKSTDPKKEIILKPNYPGNSILVEVKDQNSGLNGVEIFLFANESQAKNIENDEPKNFVQKATSNNLGKAIFYNLPSSQYYIASKSNMVISNIEIVDLRQSNSKSVVLNIIPKAPNPKLTLKLLDNIGDLLSGIETFIFSSKVSQANIFAKVVTNNIANGTTNNKGEIVFAELPINQNLYIASKGYFLKNNKVDTTFAILESPLKLTKDTTVSLSFE